MIESLTIAHYAVKYRPPSCPPEPKVAVSMATYLERHSFARVTFERIRNPWTVSLFVVKIWGAEGYGSGTSILALLDLRLAPDKAKGESQNDRLAIHAPRVKIVQLLQKE